MKFVEIKETEIQNRNAGSKRVADFLEEFYRSQYKFARVDLLKDEYKNYHVAQQSMHTAAKKRGLPVRVFTRNGIVYLENLEL